MEKFHPYLVRRLPTSANPVRHDYRLETYKSGWAIVVFDFLDAGMARIEAFGLNVLPGDEIVISMPDGEVLYEISKIRYYRDPYDLYEAELKYVQHLTGMTSLSHTEDRQRARSVEWNQHHSSGHIHITEYGSREESGTEVDWESLSEDEKQRRLNVAIEAFKED